MKKTTLVSLLILNTILTGCGKGSTGGGAGASKWKKTQVGGTPILLEKQDQSCIATFSTGEEITFYLNQFLDASSQLTEISFTNQVRNNYVESIKKAPITAMKYETTVNYEIVAEYDEDDDTVKLISDSGLVVKEEGAGLNVCPSTSIYRENSYEAAGLNISHSITKAYDAVSEAMPSINLPAIKVYVAPSISYIKKIINEDGNYQFDQTMTDNAFYYSELNMISFLPESEEHKMEAPLWEIPMVGAHEYGHHVFHTLIGQNIKGQLKTSLGCFKNHHGIGHVQHNFMDTRDTSAKGFTLGAINEGFADLIAFYSLESKEGSLAGVSCMDKNRVVTSSSFADGTTKDFSWSARYDMDKSYESEADSDCKTPNYQEIHDVGAIFAHIADKLMSKVLDSKADKLKSLLKYAKLHNSNLEDLSELKPSSYMYKTLQLLYKAALNESGVSQTSSEKYCQDINEHFSSYWSKKCELL